MRKLIFMLLISSAKVLAQTPESALPKELAQANYFRALDELKAMLQEELEPSFKMAVFTVENAFMNNQLSLDEYNQDIAFLAGLARYTMLYNKLIYEYSDKPSVEKFGGIFLVFTDTIEYLSSSGVVEAHYPYIYDFEDFWGEKDWTKMFVTKLLNTGKGNCHSMPFLYKILAEEMGETAYLAMAPNHTYIKLQTEKTGWFNTELTSATFPIDAWIMASGYVHISSIQNGIYMDTLSLQQSIAVTVTDLANGYQKRFGKASNPEFVLKCLDVVLEYYPNYMNALLLKVETMKVIFERMIKDYTVESPRELLEFPKPKAWFDSMEKLYFQIHNLGYRKMPKQMYLNWLADLQEHKDKYVNKEIIGNIGTKTK